MKTQVKSALRTRFPTAAARWWKLKHRTRDRFPEAVQLFRRTKARVDVDGRRQARVNRWMREGRTLLKDLGEASVSFDNDGVWVRDASGALWMHTLGPDGPALPWCYSDLHEREELELLRSRLGPGDVFVDVGANIGTYAVGLARSIPGLKVVAIEPVSGTHAALLANIAKNGVSDRIDVHRVALSDISGEAILTADLSALNYVVAGHRDGPVSRRYLS